MLTLLGAVSAAPNATGRAVNASGRVLLTAAVSREAGTHNTMASYMDARAALELGDDTCETCTPSENAIDNCCSPGASWEGTCGDGLAHTWLAGYSACNGGAAELSPVTGAKVIREQMYANNQTEADLAPESRRILQMKRARGRRARAQGQLLCSAPEEGRRLFQSPSEVGRGEICRRKGGSARGGQGWQRRRAQAAACAPAPNRLPPRG